MNKFILIALTLAGATQAHNAFAITCQSYPGQISFNVGVDLQYASVSQQRYALQDGPASDLARQLHILPLDHHGPGVETLSIRRVGKDGTLDFTLDDKSVHSLSVTGLNIAFGIATDSDGKVREVLTVKSGEALLISAGSLPENCTGIF